MYRWASAGLCGQLRQRRRGEHEDVPSLAGRLGVWDVPQPPSLPQHAPGDSSLSAKAPTPAVYCGRGAGDESNPPVSCAQNAQKTLTIPDDRRKQSSHAAPPPPLPLAPPQELGGARGGRVRPAAARRPDAPTARQEARRGGNTPIQCFHSQLPFTLTPPPILAPACAESGDKLSGYVRPTSFHVNGRKRLLDAAAAARIRRGMIRYLWLVLDFSVSVSEPDIRPTRLAYLAGLVPGFIRQFFAQNPLSQLGLMCARDSKAERITELSGSPEAHIAAFKKALSASGAFSLQNCIDQAVGSLQNIPPFGSREILIVQSSLSTCDPVRWVWVAGPGGPPPTHPTRSPHHIVECLSRACLLSAPSQAVAVSCGLPLLPAVPFQPTHHPPTHPPYPHPPHPPLPRATSTPRSSPPRSPAAASASSASGPKCTCRDGRRRRRAGCTGCRSTKGTWRS